MLKIKKRFRKRQATLNMQVRFYKKRKEKGQVEIRQHLFLENDLLIEMIIVDAKKSLCSSLQKNTFLTINLM